MNLDSILGVAKDYIQDSVVKNANVPKQQHAAVSDVIFNSVSKNLTSQLGGGSKSGFDLSKLGGLLGGGSGTSGILDSLSKPIIADLVKKTGMKSGVAQNVVSSILPGLLGTLTKKIGGGGVLGNVAGGLLGNLLGKK